MLTIRLFRVGKKNQPAYKIVVTDKRNAASRGRFVEEVGFYNPLTKQRNLKGDRVKYWISIGAQPSDTVHNMLVAESVIEGTKTSKVKKSKKAPAVVEEIPTTEQPKAEGTSSPEAPAEAETTSETPAEIEKAPKTAPEEPKEAPKEEPAPEDVPAAVASTEAEKEPKEEDSSAEKAEKPA